jgi:hypothetical protein
MNLILESPVLPIMVICSGSRSRKLMASDKLVVPCPGSTAIELVVGALLLVPLAISSIGCLGAVPVEEEVLVVEEEIPALLSDNEEALVEALVVAIAVASATLA